MKANIRAAAASHKLRTAEIAKRLGVHISVPIRWIKEGILLRSGERQRLKATAIPKAWLVAEEDLDDFLAELTADRLGQASGAATIASPSDRRRAHELAERQLDALGV